MAGQSRHAPVIDADVHSVIASVEVLQPPMTTVRTSHFELGRLSTELLIDLIERREAAPARRLSPPP